MEDGKFIHICRILLNHVENFAKIYCMGMLSIEASSAIDAFIYAVKDEQKMGCPTDAIKDSVIKVRIDEQTKRMMEYCVEISSMSKSNVVRQGIENIYDEFKGENKK